jgi:nucleotide-binding universal stress UspA family protein
MFLPADESIEALDMLGEWKGDAAIRRQRQTINRDVRKRMTELVTAHVPEGQNVAVRLVQGEAAGAITRAARRCNADLVVMGTMARAGIPGFLLGSTTERVLRTCERSVLTIQPEGFTSPIQPPAWSLHPAEAETAQP